MRRYLRLIKAKHEGFTLLEILIVMVITGVLATGIITTVNQIYTQNNRATRNMLVVQNVESAGYWVSRDALMAQNVTSGSFPLNMEWQDWDQNSLHQIVYSLAGNTLQRSVFVNAIAVTQTTVARNINIDPTMTNYVYADGVLTFKITATIDSYSETRTYEIKLRTEPFAQ